MPQKKKPNFTPYGNKKPKKPYSITDSIANLGAPKASKKQSGSGGNARKTHDTKGKNNHGRRSW